MLKGEWPKPKNCTECDLPVNYKAEFPAPPRRVYECKRGHPNIVYMRKIKEKRPEKGTLAAFLDDLVNS